MNSFGTRLRFTSFGESHGEAIGCVLDGLPAGLVMDEDFLRAELAKRRGGGPFATARREEDEVKILSGLFGGLSTGSPLGMIIFNQNARSKDYEGLERIFRPGHADWTYFHKYGLRDHRGGGRASARESVARVAAGAVAGMLLREFGIEVASGVLGVGGVLSTAEPDFDLAGRSEIFALDPGLEEAFKNEILQARRAKDSVGAVVLSRALGLPVGLGEVLYEKLDAKLAHALMGLNAVKAVEIGSGTAAAASRGSENNDEMRGAVAGEASAGGGRGGAGAWQGGPRGEFMSNHSGGVLGGISTGEELVVRTFFKPTPSIFRPQRTVDVDGRDVICELGGRHDPCVGVRGSVVVSAMIRLVLADCLLLNATARLENLKKIY